MRNISSINLSFTTHCNMQCPDCCCNITHMPKAQKRFFDWAYFETAAKYFHGMKRIHLTGGEPTMHPDFTTFVPKLKELFGCKLLTLETNGTMFRKFPEVFRNFDRIYITHYTAATFAGSPDNTGAIAFIKDFLKNSHTEIIVGDVIHTPRTQRGNKMCARGTSETVAYCDGKIYPCCVAPGLETKIFIEPTDNWMHEIEQVHPPCNECFFAEL